MSPLRNYLNKEKWAWADADGTLHVDAVRMCEVLGVEPTQENQDIAEEEMRRLMREENPTIPVKSVRDLL
jgi:DnaJ-domain-containing protein 1